MKKNILDKLTSRKFIVAAITVVAGIVTMIIGDNEIVQIIAGAAMTIVPTVVYCIMEGMVDAKSVDSIADATADAAEKLGVKDNVVDMIEQAGDVIESLVETEKKE